MINGFGSQEKDVTEVCWCNSQRKREISGFKNIERKLHLTQTTLYLTPFIQLEYLPWELQIWRRGLLNQKKASQLTTSMTTGMRIFTIITLIKNALYLLTKHDTPWLKKQAKYYLYNSLTKRILRQRGRYWAIRLTKPKVAPILREFHDHAGHFDSKIVLDRLRFRVYKPKMAADVREYIRGCLSCMKWAMSARSVPLTVIQTGERYELMGIDFIDPLSKIGIRQYRHLQILEIIFQGIYTPTALLEPAQMMLLFRLIITYKLKS